MTMRPVRIALRTALARVLAPGVFALAYAALALVGAFLTGMPPAVTAMVMASTYRLWEGGATAIVGVGTIVGLGTATLFLLTVL